MVRAQAKHSADQRQAPALRASASRHNAPAPALVYSVFRHGTARWRTDAAISSGRMEPRFGAATKQP
jgi:hypothetical protein